MKAKTKSIDYLKSQYDFEVNFHREILKEPDIEKRKQMYFSAYDHAYRESERLSPTEIDFGFQDPELQIVAPFLRDKVIIDYGCGYGSSSLYAGRYAKSVVGCDILPSVIEKAKERLREDLPVNFKLIEPATLPFEDASTDVVYASDVIEHLHPEDAAAFVKKVYAVLRPGGHFICITPHPLFGPSDISAHFLPLGARSTGFHIKEYSYSELIRLCQEGGFQSFSTPVLSPRHIVKLPFYESCSPLFFQSPQFRILAESSAVVQTSLGLKRFLGLNRAVYLVMAKA